MLFNKLNQLVSCLDLLRFKSFWDVIFFLVLNINGNIVQIANTGQSVTNSNNVGQATAVNTASAATVVPQATLATNAVTTSPNSIAGVSNGNIVMVRNNAEVRALFPHFFFWFFFYVEAQFRFLCLIPEIEL